MYLSQIKEKQDLMKINTFDLKKKLIFSTPFLASE